MDLPTPMTPENTPGAITPAPERIGSALESMPRALGTVSPLPAIALPVPTAPLPNNPVNTAASAQDDSLTPGIAADVDLIEKEWVQKAKAIIYQTQNDPHQQSKELNIFKADYMQKRYNKVLKLSE